MNCRRGGRECDGSLMRTDKRYERVRTMLRAELPVGPVGFAACHYCQRSAYFAGGFVALLANDLRNMARFHFARRAAL